MNWNSFPESCMGLNGGKVIVFAKLCKAGGLDSFLKISS